jgi:hypothetical protein
VFLTLMRKDLRLLRAPIVAAILISLFVEFVIGGISAYGLYRQIEASNGAISAANYAFGVAERTWLVLCIGCAFAAIFAGVGAPVERRERWADLAAMVPVPRWRRTLARLVVAATLSLAYIGVHAIIYLACLWLVPARWMPSRYYYALDPIAAVAVGMFGVAWLGASFARSPAINVGVAIAIVMGVAATVLGTIVESRRVEP